MLVVLAGVSVPMWTLVQMPDIGQLLSRGDNLVILCPSGQRSGCSKTQAGFSELTVCFTALSLLGLVSRLHVTWQP